MSEAVETTVVESSLPEDFAAYRAIRTAEPKPAEEAPEQTEVEPEPPVEDGKTEPESDPEKTEQEQTRDEHGKFKSKDDELPPGVQKRIQKEIDKAVRARKEAEELLNKAREEAAKRDTAPAQKPEQPAATKSETPPEPPSLDDFDTTAAWSKAVAAWAKEQAAAEAKAEAAKLTKSELEARDKSAAEKKAQEEGERLREVWSTRVDEARKQHNDFDEVLDDAKFPDTPAIRAVQQAFYESEDGAELLYHLAANPETAARLSKLTPSAALRELGKIEASLKPAAPPVKESKPAVSAAPPPMKTVTPRAAAGPVRDPDKMTFAQYVEWRRKNGGK